MKVRQPAAMAIAAVAAVTVAVTGCTTPLGQAALGTSTGGSGSTSSSTSSVPLPSSTTGVSAPPLTSPTSGTVPPTVTTSAPTAPTTTSPSSTAQSSTSPASTHPTAPASNLGPGYVEPDGFVLNKLQPGEKPPQFVAVSFDGAGWHEKWDYFRGIAAKVPFHFTANLTGLYLMDGQHRTYYHGPHHKPGATSLGSWNTPAEVSQQIADLNRAYADGNEIATHFMGHFCDDNPPGAGTWTTADWNSDLDQFFDVWKNYRTIDQNAGLPALTVPASSVKGARTPCLQGSREQLFPALAAHGFTYDQSFTRRGISWPTKSPQYGIWNMGMAEFPMHGTVPGFGTGHVVITMDYNFWYTQEADPNTGQMRKVPPAKSAADSRQVQATYQDMLDGALAGSHAPLLLGNHFEEWNNNAYTDALGNFLIANCGRPEVHCVPFRDIVDWMSIQDPATLARLQAAPPVLGPPNSGSTQP